jgi:hypothetical protein
MGTKELDILSWRIHVSKQQQNSDGDSVRRVRPAHHFITPLPEREWLTFAWDGPDYYYRVSIDNHTALMATHEGLKFFFGCDYDVQNAVPQWFGMRPCGPGVLDNYKPEVFEMPLEMCAQEADAEFVDLMFEIYEDSIAV